MHTRKAHINTRLGLCSALAAAGLAALVTTPAHAAPPSNDQIEDAVVVSDLPFTDTRDTTEATATEGDSGCGAETVWYTFTPDTDAVYQIDTIGTNYDNILAIFEGSPGDLTYVAGCGQPIRQELTAGTTYFIEVGQVAQEGGTLVFNVNFAAPDLDIQLTLNPVGRISKDGGTVTLSGTVTCNHEAIEPTFYIYAVLRQRQGLNLLDRPMFAGSSCTTTPTIWTGTTDQNNRVWLPKKATVQAQANGCDDFTCDQAFVDQTIRLRK